QDVQVAPPTRDDVRERTIAEFAGDGAEGSGDAPMTTRLREAAQGAEQAIERERVPTHRTDLVRRYFERIRSSAERSRDAQDVESGGS
ncbi:MAG: hypothetical protein KDA28_00440, partial [Phycisphaerales bacterium]|nr:hypothetical protein [Phycisphaerales bacterium]